MTKPPNNPRNIKIGLLFPQKDIFLFFNIKGTISIIKRLRKNIISIKGSSLKKCTATAIKVKQIEAIIIIKIPTLDLSSPFFSKLDNLILLIMGYLYIFYFMFLRNIKIS